MSHAAIPYPLGPHTDRPEWTAARSRTPEEVQAVRDATVRQALRSWVRDAQ